jgi:PAB-dependent poly(A)-specific ribonuclease subunit 3
MDPRWSETGDRYLLKLFRDYVFHQVYDDGNPAIDLGHVVDTLNKVWVGGACESLHVVRTVRVCTNSRTCLLFCLAVAVAMSWQLDVGSAEKVALMTRDEKSILVVSYKDIKRCVENAFSELLHKQDTNYL